jgi:hypothetical protein
MAKTTQQPPDIYEGAVFCTKGSGDVEVLQYENCNNILVKFSDGHTKKVAAKELRNGSIKNDFSPNVCGVGFLGKGVYKATEYVDGKKVNTPAYEVWRGVMRRCYDETWQKSKRITYSVCSVDSEWHNFQNFAEWYYNHKHYGKGYHLDKDLSVLGNKIYGPQYCDLIPAEVNSIHTGTSSTKRGVHFCNTKKKYIVQCHTDGRQNYFGAYETEKQALDIYSIAKKSQVDKVIDKYSDVLSKRILDNLAVMFKT